MTGYNRTNMKNRKSKRAKQTAIQLTDISKEYVLRHEKPTLIETITGVQKERFFALKDINVTIHKGEKVAIIGPNGSGKTTLLKIIAGITNPSSGRVKNIGNIASLIDIEAGFHPDLTGEQNIYINGLLVGMSRAEIKSKFDKIITFADLGKFINTPLYTYSEGMKLRLGFSIAIHASPEILLFDEKVSVGDINFHNKFQKRIKNQITKTHTVITASHWIHYLEKHCNRFIWLDKGKVEMDGDKSVAQKYLKRYQYTNVLYS